MKYEVNPFLCPWTRKWFPLIVNGILVCAHFSSKQSHGTYCLCSITQLFRLLGVVKYFPCYINAPNRALVALNDNCSIWMSTNVLGRALSWAWTLIFCWNDIVIYFHYMICVYTLNILFQLVVATLQLVKSPTWYSPINTAPLTTLGWASPDWLCT